MNFSVIEQVLEQCDIISSIITDKLVYENESIDFFNMINDTRFQFTIEYWIDDLFGNTIDGKSTTANLNKKRYTPKLNNDYGVLVIKNRIYPLCNDTNLSNNFAEKVVIAKKIQQALQEEKKPKAESDVWVRDIIGPTEKISPGDIIKVRLKAYKGDTSKNLVKVWIAGTERISEDTSFNIYEKFTEYELTVPIAIKDKCNIPSGKYKVVVEGLDDVDRQGVYLDFEQCEAKDILNIKNVAELSSRALPDNNNPQICTQKETIEAKKTECAKPIASEYKSSSYIMMGLVPWMIAIMTSIIAVVLIWRR